MNIRTTHIFIDRRLHFEEPLQEVELVEEETVEIPSCSADHSDDENGSEGSDISDMIYDISEHNISGFESDSNVPTHLPKWAKNTLSSPGQTLEILLIQEEPDQIFKEQVLLFLVMIP